MGAGAAQGAERPWIDPAPRIKQVVGLGDGRALASLEGDHQFVAVLEVAQGQVYAQRLPLTWIDTPELIGQREADHDE